MVLPVFIPLMFSFAMTLGYVLMFLGHVLVASAMGENDHPRWPEWHPSEISEGLGRWLWALLFGVALGGLPIVAYWGYMQRVDWLRGFVFVDLVLFGTAFAQMALAAALMHDTIIAANPITVLAAIFQIGWEYVVPCLVGQRRRSCWRAWASTACSSGCPGCGWRPWPSGPSGSSCSTRPWS